MVRKRKHKNEGAEGLTSGVRNAMDIEPVLARCMLCGEIALCYSTPDGTYYCQKKRCREVCEAATPPDF